MPQKAKILLSLRTSQQDMEAYSRQEREGFSRLLDDIAHKRLSRGMAQQSVVARYGDPVFCSEGNVEGFRKKCLYRDPFAFFAGDRVYLYYDHNGMLTHWQILAAASK